MTTLWQLPAALAVPFLAAAGLRLWPGERSARTAGVVATVASVGWFASVLPLVADAVAGSPVSFVSPWIPSLDVTFALRMDGLSALFVLLVGGIGSIVLAYATSYMEGHDRLGPFFATMLAFQGSMLGVVLADDVLLLFLFWELTSLTSFLLIGYHRDDPDSIYSARKAMIITVSGGVTLFAGLLGVAMLGGTFRISELVAHPPDGPLLGVTMALVVAGAAAKAAQFPLHIWLPNAMVAPTPVSAYLHSAAMVKAGIYLLARVRPLYAHLAAWQVAVAGLGLVTMALTAVLALGQRDPKRLLAYSTSSQLGLIVVALGLPGAAAGGVLHVAHHAVFKAGLFLAAGVAIHAFHAETMDGMGGLARAMPGTAAATLALALASAAVPPFSGFVSKELILDAALHADGLGGPVALVGLAAASAFTVAYSLRFFSGIFLGDEPPDVEVEVPGLTQRAGVVLLGALALAGGLVPGLWDGLVGGALAATAPKAHGVHLALWHGVTPVLGVSAAVVASGVALERAHPRFRDLVQWLQAEDPLATANHLYHALLDRCQRSAFVVGRIVQRETPQTYVGYTMLGAVALVLGGMGTVGVSPGPLGVTVGPLVLVVMALVAASAVTVTRAHGYTLGIVALAAVGLLVGLLYILVGAPDVGLTQLLVETLALALFVAIVSRLPPTYIEPTPSRKVRDVAIAGLVGVTAFLAVLAATQPGPFPSVGPTYLGQVVEAAGGHNAVNVILVDYRALDTLGEITVVAIAGLAGVTLALGRFRSWST